MILIGTIIGLASVAALCILIPLMIHSIFCDDKDYDKNPLNRFLFGVHDQAETDDGKEERDSDNL